MPRWVVEVPVLAWSHVEVVADDEAQAVQIAVASESRAITGGYTTACPRALILPLDEDDATAGEA